MGFCLIIYSILQQNPNESFLNELKRANHADKHKTLHQVEPNSLWLSDLELKLAGPKLSYAIGSTQQTKRSLSFSDYIPFNL